MYLFHAVARDSSKIRCRNNPTGKLVSLHSFSAIQAGCPNLSCVAKLVSLGLPLGIDWRGIQADHQVHLRYSRLAKEDTWQPRISVQASWVDLSHQCRADACQANFPGRLSVASAGDRLQPSSSALPRSLSRRVDSWLCHNKLTSFHCPLLLPFSH